MIKLLDNYRIPGHRNRCILFRENERCRFEKDGIVTYAMTALDIKTLSTRVMAQYLQSKDGYRTICRTYFKGKTFKPDSGGYRGYA